MFPFSPDIAVLSLGTTSPVAPDGAIAVKVASSPRQALEMLKARHFDLLIVTAELRGADWSELVRRVRIECPATPWALVDSQSSESARDVARMLGAAAIYDQPPDAEALQALIRRLRDQATRRVLSAGRRES
jgi:DNA-binding response OmpR family regulator